MTDIILNNMPLWTAAVKHKSAAGRGSRSKLELTGIKKLRELILELAVRGQLVPQEPSDEPASVLLERIASEKAELLKAGKLKKQKPLPEITDEEKPFALPMGWEWVRLGDALEVINGRAYKKTEMLDKGTPILRVGNLFTSNEWYYSDLELEPEKYIDDGDLIYAWSASFGPFIWQGGKVIYHYHIWKLDIFDCSSTSKEFLYLYLKSITEQIKASGNGIAMLHMTKERMEQLLFPVPSFSEQKRIVAKVDELMALCDQLEQQTENHTGAHQQLVETVLATLTNTQSADELTANWARLAAHFDLLFAGPMGSWAVDRLKDTILQLAVQGKLVPQNPADEPASALLARIEAEKAELIKQGKLKKQKPLPPISDDEKHFELPQGWEWVRFDNLILGSDAGWSPQCEPSPRVDEGWGVLKVSAVTWGEYRPEENKALPVHLQPKKEYEVVAGDFLISRANTAELVARSVVVPDAPPPNLMMSDKIIRLRLSDLVNRYFINLINGSGYARNYYLTVAGGTSSSMKNVSRAQIHELIIALPPQSEQTRIVEKVDQLFALCDQLKAALDAACDTQLQLSSAVVEQSLALH